MSRLLRRCHLARAIAEQRDRLFAPVQLLQRSRPVTSGRRRRQRRRLGQTSFPPTGRVGPRLLQSIRLGRGGFLTGALALVELVLPLLGLLVLGKAPRDWLPGAYVQFLRIQGTQLSDSVADDLLIDGRLRQIIRRLDEKLALTTRGGQRKHVTVDVFPAYDDDGGLLVSFTPIG